MGYIKVQTATVLTSDTASKSVGGMVMLKQLTASNSATLSFTSVISSTYLNYCLVYSNVLPVSGSTLTLLVSTNNGSSYLATGYQSGAVRLAYNGAGLVAESSSTAQIVLSGNNSSTTQPITGTAYLMNVQNGGTFQTFGYAGYWTAVYHSTLLCGYNTATSVNAFQVAMSTGNISTGTFTLYGIIE